MVYYTVFTIFDAIRTLLGYKTSGVALRMVPLQNAAVTASPGPITESTAPGNREASQNSEAGGDNEDLWSQRLQQGWESVRSASSTDSVMGNGASKRHGHAVLRGSPKGLGWTIDEAEEENAWVLIMHDAMKSSVFEVKTADDGDSITSPIAPSNQDIIKFFASQEQPGVSYVWRIIPSLTGAHQWSLHREAEPLPNQEVPAEPEAVRVMGEIQTDTEDLVEHCHLEAMTQTTVKTYNEVAVQVEELEAAVPAGALSPLPESTDLVDVLPADLRPVSPGNATTTAIDSRPGTPNSLSRIPRLASRRGSVASFQTTSTRASSPVPAPVRGGPSPVPVPAIRKVVRQATSIRSMALRKASSKASMKPVPVEATADARPVEIGGLERKKAGGRFFDAVKRIGRSDSVWKP